jgi:hypothetical protein
MQWPDAQMKKEAELDRKYGMIRPKNAAGR